MAGEHIPVLLEPILDMVRHGSRTPQFFLDATFGRGGHTRAIMEQFPELKTVALDQDHEAIEAGKKEFAQEMASGRIHFFRANFANFEQVLESDLKSILNGQLFDIILLDLGVSSPQLDQPERGFSFYHSGPLDMRMDQRQELTAKDIINTWSEDDLIDLFQTLGEIRRPQKVVRSIVDLRREKEFVTTRDIASLIEKIEGWRAKGHHPATRFFMALRLQVNQELNVLTQAIPQLVKGLNEGGRLLIITFHSLEDRLVKYALREHLELGYLVNKKVIQSKWEEQKKNPRARSAKLRVFQKGAKDESSTGE